MKQLQTLPSIELDIAGAPADGGLMRSLAGFRVQQRISLPTVAELVFRDPPGPLGDLEAVTVGTALRLDAANSGVVLVEGEVTAVEHAFMADGVRETRIRAYDPSHRLRKRQPVRAHVDATAAGLARSMTADCGLEVQTAHEGPVWPRVIQHDQSDFELLEHLLEQAGLYFTVRQQVMHLLTLDGIGPEVALRFGEELLEARVEVNGDAACWAVETHGWNPLSAETHHGSAAEPRVGLKVGASATPDAVGGDGTRNLAGVEVVNGQHADALAQAELDRCRGGEVTIWAVAEGDPRLRPGAWVDLGTPADQFGGRYVITAATHTLDERRGFVSEISSLVPEPRARPAALRTTLGVVFDVADPAGLGRVRVAMPSIGGLETDWVDVLLPAAGPGKGIIALPAPDDRVLVLLGSPELSQAVVLGGLYGTTTPPDPGVDANKVVRYVLTTPSGQRLTLEDDTKTVRLEDANGNLLEMGPHRIRVDGVVDIEMSAPGRRLLFRGKAIDFEQA